MQRSTRSHRWAVKHFQSKPEKIKATGDRKWELQGRTPEEKFQVSYQEGCVCSVSLSEKVHCPLCDGCPYSRTCTCLDNRTGISCLHRHAAKQYGWDLAVQPSSTSAITSEGDGSSTRELPIEAVYLDEPSTSVSLDVEGPPTSAAPVMSAQERKQERSEMRNSIESKYSVVYTSVNLLLNTDTDEALTSLKQIYDLVDQAFRKLSTPSEPQIAVKPELSKPRGKPQLTKAELYTVSGSYNPT
ncbi:hypothetical protein Aduo_018562 [Ancylostoma duodenale]